jgi:tRNA threonylcarbamoyladenosine biosynthesis protein TsaE
VLVSLKSESSSNGERKSSKNRILSHEYCSNDMRIAFCRGMVEIHRSRSVAQTEAIAAKVVAGLRGGECIALHGDLGAGKTQFTRGIVTALGGNPLAVCSPTFVLLNVYKTARFDVFHLDAYRVCGPEELEAIGFTELLGQGGVVIVEWAERIAALLPKDHLSIRLTATGVRTRKITVEATGDRVR